MDDPMELDDPLPPPLPATSDPSILLRHVLHPFIRRNISRALGEDMVTTFTPPSNATLYSLLTFILSKWQSIFEDSVLSPHRHTLETLQPLTKQLNSDPSVEHSLCERLLIALGHPSVAARVTSPSPSLPLPHRTPLTLASSSSAPSAHAAVKVVLDGSNIAWAHGRSHFSIRGAAEALEYFSTRGHSTVLFLPEARVQKSDKGKDDVYLQAICQLQGTSHLVTTPSTDYDDTYMSHYARRTASVLVSNDRFRDQVYQATATQTHESWERWLTHCRLSFTFHAHSFMPNPSFNWQKAAMVAEQLRLA